MKTVIEMAREADPKANLSEPYRLDHETRAWLEGFAALVRADEREACAAQLDFNAQASSNGGDEYLAALLWQEAEEIRARGNT